MAKFGTTKYIVRQPIKDLQGTVLGYEIRYTGENTGYNGEEGQDFSAAETIYNFLTQASDTTFKGAMNFMTFTTNLLMKQTPKLFSPEELVIEIGESAILHPLAMRFVERYRQEGYAIAVKDFQFSPRFISNLRQFDYVMMDLPHAGDASVRRLAEMVHSMGKKCVVTGVDTEELYQKAFILGADALCGRYAAEQMFTAVHSASYLQSNFFRLLVAVTKDEPEVDEIEQIISMDASLTYSLLRIVNSAYFALRNRATDVHQAIMVLGIGQLRQWIYLMGSGNEGEMDASQEVFLKTSFMRATFCGELMKYAKNMPIQRNDAYLLGMFSTLNFLIAAPLEEILEEIPISQEVKNALLRHEGRCGLLYDLVLSYEQADWKRIGPLAEELGIPLDYLTDTYFRCLEEVNSIWQQLMDPNTNFTSAEGEAASAPQS